MGFTRKVLTEKGLGEKSVFYSDKLIIELAESLHIHIRNFRIEFSLEEWELFAKSVIKSWYRYWQVGKPGYLQPKDNLKLFRTKINPVAGSGKDSILRNDMKIELQEFADSIHFHFRNTRYEFTIDEFLEFSDEVLKARESIMSMEELNDYPKRVGYNHIMQPKNRVTESKNPGNFITHDSRFLKPDSKSYDSLVYDVKTKSWNHQFQVNNTKEPLSKVNLSKRIIHKFARRLWPIMNTIFRIFK